MAITPASLDALLEAEKESDAFICPISQLRFFPDVIRVKGWLEAGIMGRMTMVDLSMKYWRSEDYYINNPWRGTWEHDGGGALMNQGIHGLDLLRWLCSTPDCISASADTLVHDIETEDTLSASLRFSSGALGVMSVSTAAFPGFPRRLEICCEKGSLTLEEGHLVACTLPDAETSSNTRSGHSDPAAIDFLPHQLQYENIVGAIEQKAPLAVTSEDAAQTLRLIFDIYSRAGIRKG